MNAAPVHRRTASSSLTENASNTVKGKALHYQSENSSSLSDSRVLKGRRQPAQEEAAEKQLLYERKDENVIEKSGNDDVSRERRTIDGPTIDSLVFTRVNSTIQHGKLVVHRTPGERLRNPERLNLDRRDLDACPLLQHEDKLRLLNYQNNNITAISNLENLPQLIFLDFYNNNLRSLDGPLPWVPGLRVLMAGKNQINAISNLSHLKKLDVLDLHSNEISEIQGLDSLTELRVLNLAGNQIVLMQNLSCLRSLTELNIRRNCLESVKELDALPALQRVFLSHNFIASFSSIRSLFAAKNLLELSLDGNPLSESDPSSYRSRVIENLPKLKHLDLKLITPEERALSSAMFKNPTMEEVLAEGPSSTPRPPKPQISQKAKGSTSTSSQKKKNSFISRSPDLMNLFVDSTKSSRSAISEGEGSAAADGMSGKDSQRTSETSFPSSFSPLDGNLKTGGRTTKGHEDRRVIQAEGEEWRWQWDSAECGDDREGTIAWLEGVTEVTVRHMSVPRALSEVSVHAHRLPSVSTLQLVDNGITTLPQISLLLAGFDGIERLSVLNNPVCLSKSSLRSYIVRAMPRLKVFNDLIITDDERASSPTPTPAPMPSISAPPVRDRPQTIALQDPQQRGRDKGREKVRSEREIEIERETERETVPGPRAGSAMCYPLRARDLDREEGDSLSHTTASSSSPRPSSPSNPHFSDTDTYANFGSVGVTDASPHPLAQNGSTSTSTSSRDVDSPVPVPEESERIFKAMVLMYFRQVIHETVESLCPI